MYIGTVSWRNILTNGIPRKNYTIWVDGEFTSIDDAKLSVICQSLHYGFGVIEGVRGYKVDGGINLFRLPEHIERLFDGARKLGLDTPFDQSDLIQAHTKLVHENRLGDCYLRSIVYSNSTEMNFSLEKDKTSWVVASWSFKDSIHNDYCLATSPYPRYSSTLSSVKSMANYQPSIMSYNFALQKGYNDALLLDEKGNLSESTGSNIFLICNNRLVTPRLGSCLSGITRFSIIEIANKLGLSVIEKEISLSEAYNADAIFLVGTAMGVKNVKQLDGVFYKQSPIFTQLKDAYLSIISCKSNHGLGWGFII